MKTLLSQLDAAAPPGPPHTWQGYAVGLFLAACGVGLMAVWHPAAGHMAALLGIPAIIAAAALGGMWPGLATTAALLAGQWALDLSHAQEDAGLLSHLAMTAIYGVTISVGAEAYRRQRARAEGNARRLGIREAHLQLMLDTVPDAMLVCDESGIVRSFSSAAERMFGRDADDVLGQCVTHLMGESDVQAGLNRHLENDGQGPSLAAGRRSDGSTFPVEVTVASFTTAGQAFFTIIARDRTVLDAAERKEADLRSELTFAWRQNSVGELAALLAHEINQPLAAITNYLGAARNIASQHMTHPVRVIEAIERASAQAMRASEIIRRLRTLVERSDEGQKAEDLKALLLEVDAFVRLTAREADVRVEYVLSEQPMIATADRIQIQQVVLNLVRNAVDAMVGAPRRLLRISACPAGEDMQISIEDSGPGIAEDLLPKLFLPVRSTKPNGMGVGLSICRTIVEAHGGRIWCEKSPLGGAAICFTLADNNRRAVDVAAA
jgi:two-component system sensor kinase FixL